MICIFCKSRTTCVFDFLFFCGRKHTVNCFDRAAIVHIFPFYTRGYLRQSTEWVFPRQLLTDIWVKLEHVVFLFSLWVLKEDVYRPFSPRHLSLHNIKHFELHGVLWSFCLTQEVEAKRATSAPVMWFPLDLTFCSYYFNTCWVNSSSCSVLTWSCTVTKERPLANGSGNGDNKWLFWQICAKAGSSLPCALYVNML